jgi:hypothetical protein
LQASTVRKTYPPRPFGSWALNALITYDEALPCTLRRVLCASSLRRQCTFHTLSLLHYHSLSVGSERLRTLADPRGWEDNQQAEIASILTTRRVRDILYALHGPVDGLVGVLSRLGDQPLLPTTYWALVSILSEPQHRARAKVLQQHSEITSSTVSVLLALRKPWIRGDLLSYFKSTEQVSQFTAAVELIQDLVPGVAKGVLVQSLNSDVTLSQWVTRWIKKASQFPISPPVPQGGDFVLLDSAQAIRDAATRYRNCLRGRVGYVATGRAAFLEHRSSNAIIELQSLSEGRWLLDSINGPGNRRVDPTAARTICHELRKAGILVRAHLAHAQKYTSTARLLRIHDADWIDDTDEYDGELDLSDLEAELDEVVREFGFNAAT